MKKILSLTLMLMVVASTASAGLFCGDTYNTYNYKKVRKVTKIKNVEKNTYVTQEEDRDGGFYYQAGIEANLLYPTFRSDLMPAINAGYSARTNSFEGETEHMASVTMVVDPLLWFYNRNKE